jgi:flagellar basal-body rod modification protein FlgD
MMVDETKKIGRALDPSLGVPSPSDGGLKDRNIKNEVGQQEFLQLLVTQLQNQDPLDPMKNEQFAVDLAQFSQLEQLVEINQKLGDSSSSASLAGFLGQKVTLNGDKLNIKGGKGPDISFDLASDATNVSIDLFDAQGDLVQSYPLGGMQAGPQTVTSQGLTVPDGEYTFAVRADSPQGGNTTPPATVGGIVSGFIPGPEPRLIVGGQEVSLSEIARVDTPS